MSLSRTILRKYVFPVLCEVRADSILRAATNNSLLNIMYHGVVTESSLYFSPRHIHCRQFESHLQYFRKHFEIITTGEAFQRIRNHDAPIRKAIAISFDDGFQNNLKVALPLLEKYGIPATFFISSVCTEETDPHCLWAEKINAMQYFYPDEVISLEDYRFTRLKDREHGISLPDLIKSAAPADRDRWLDLITRKYDLSKKLSMLPEEVWKLMTQEEVRQLSRSEYVETGSHGHLHYNLGEIDSGLAMEELAKSKRLLEETINEEVNLFAYPDGSYTDALMDLAEQTGYTGQMAVTYRTPASLKDMRIMNRHGISSGTTFASNMLFMSAAFIHEGLH